MIPLSTKKNSSKKTKWWHYGEDKGGIQISSGTKVNPSPSGPTEDNQSET